MATGIYPLPNGKYRWHIMIEGKRFHGMADCSKEAQQQRAEKLTESAKGTVVAPNRITFNEQLDGWLSSKDRTTAQRTAASYRYMAGKYVPDSLKKQKLRDIKPAHIRAVYEDLHSRALDHSTIRQTHIIIHGVLESAIKDEVLGRNPAHGLKPSVISKDDVKDLLVFSPDEARRFITACRVHNWGHVFQFLLLTGVRRGEVCGLTWANVVLDAKMPYVRIEQAVGNLNGKATITRPKTKSSRRAVHLHADTARMLVEMRDEREARLGVPTTPSDFVFANRSGGMIQPDHLKRHMAVISEAAGVPKIRIHDLRHTYASLALRAGSRIEAVSKQLGHSSVTMTLDVYRHVYTDELESAVISPDVLMG